MQNELDDFLHFCRVERRLAPLTCSAYARDISACIRFLSENGIGDLGLVRPPDLRRFLASEAERRPALGSQARTVAALKCFFRFCVENECLERDPALVLRTPKKREALPDVLDQRELARLLQAPERAEEGFVVETPTKRIGKVAGIRYGAHLEEPEALAVRPGRFGRTLLLVSVDSVERVLPEERRIVVTDPPRLLPR